MEHNRQQAMKVNQPLGRKRGEGCEYPHLPRVKKGHPERPGWSLCSELQRSRRQPQKTKGGSVCWTEYQRTVLQRAQRTVQGVSAPSPRDHPGQEIIWFHKPAWKMSWLMRLWVDYSECPASTVQKNGPRLNAVLAWPKKIKQVQTFSKELSCLLEL